MGKEMTKKMINMARKAVRTGDVRLAQRVVSFANPADFIPRGKKAAGGLEEAADHLRNISNMALSLQRWFENEGDLEKVQQAKGLIKKFSLAAREVDKVKSEQVFPILDEMKTMMQDMGALDD